MSCTRILPIRTSGHAGLIAWLMMAVAALTAGQVVWAVSPAEAGTVGVTARIQGAGIVASVEGGPYSCSRTGNQDDRSTVTCDRLSFEAGLEAWVWLQAVPADSPAGIWSFAGWSGCDTTRIVSGRTQCGVHSGAFTRDERYPKAMFVSRSQLKSI